MLVRKTILAPVVILVSQGPQQQGWVTDSSHSILSRLHHIVTHRDDVFPRFFLLHGQCFNVGMNEVVV